jgi:hypothetical protein
MLNKNGGNTLKPSGLGTHFTQIAFAVIPAKAGIQSQMLDTRLRGCDGAQGELGIKRASRWLVAKGRRILQGPVTALLLRIRRRQLRRFPALHDCFCALLDLAAGEENAAVAGEAFEADVGPEAHHAPFVAAARVRLAEAEDIVEVEI